MLIAVTTEKGGMDNNVCQDFDACPTITFVDSSSMTAEIHKNKKYSKKAAGKKIAQAIIDKWAKIVITGVCTPDAMKLFFKSNILLYNGFGRVRDVVEALLKGRLNVQKMPKMARSSPVGDIPSSDYIFTPTRPL